MCGYRWQALTLLYLLGALGGDREGAESGMVYIQSNLMIFVLMLFSINEGSITKIGRDMSRLPLEPVLGRMMIEAALP